MLRGLQSTCPPERERVMRRRAIALVTAVLMGVTVAVTVTGGNTAAARSEAPSLPPHGEREPANTLIERVDGTGVVFQYGEVVPSFDGWAHHEPTREYRILDGDWRFRFDPHDEGLAAGWQSPGADVSAWDTIAVPSSWDLKDNPTPWGSYDGSNFGTGTAFNDGYAWYRTTTHIPGTWAGREVRLNFLAVNYRADVWVNGRYAGAHEGGHTPFALPVRDVLRPGQDATIVVRVHRRADFTDYKAGTGPVSDPLAVPYRPIDYWPYAVITRSVWLEAVPTVNIPKVLVATRDGRLDARVVVANRSAQPFIGHVVVRPGSGSGGAPVSVPVSVAAGRVAVAHADIAIPDAPAWSPDAPNLLTATAELRQGPPVSQGPVVDQLSTTYGVRTVGVDGSALTVNGKPVFLKGVNWHEETAAHGRSMTVQEYNHELGHLLDLGANFMRNSVYNRHPYVYEWADRHGVFVMDDIDNMWLNTDQERVQTESYGLSRALAATMAWNQHNRPSVILWGLQNESEIDNFVNEPGTDPNRAPVYRAWLQDLKNAVKAVDIEDRPVTWASWTSWDPASDIADVIGVNEYWGFFYGDNSGLGPMLDKMHEMFPDKPILITENGSYSDLGVHGAETEKGTEEWHAANFRAHWDQATARSDYMAGYTFWVLKDYKERLGYNMNYNGISVMGLLGFDSTTRRVVYDAFKQAQNPR